MLLCYICHHTIIFFPEINEYFKYVHSLLWPRIDILIIDILWDSQFGDKVFPNFGKLCLEVLTARILFVVVYTCNIRLRGLEVEDQYFFENKLSKIS